MMLEEGSIWRVLETITITKMPVTNSGNEIATRLEVLTVWSPQLPGRKPAQTPVAIAVGTAVSYTHLTLPTILLV